MENHLKTWNMTGNAELEMFMEEMLNFNIKLDKLSANMSEVDRKVSHTVQIIREMDEKVKKNDKRNQIVSEMVQKVINMLQKLSENNQNVSKMEQKVRKFDQKVSEMEQQLSTLKGEMQTEMKTEIEKQVKHMEQLQKSEKMSERALSTLFKRMNALEEKLRVVEERKSDDVQLRRVIEGVVRGILEENKGEDAKSLIDEHSEDIEVVKEECEECFGEIGKSDQKLQSKGVQLEQEFKGQLTKTKDSIAEFVRKNLDENNAKEGLANNSELLSKESEGEVKERVNHLETSILTKTPQMSSYSLTNPYNDFRPDFSWTINGIAELVKQKTFQMMSEKFHFTGYDVKARAELQLKDNKDAQMSLQLSNVTKEVASNIKLIPKLYYRLRSGRSGSRHTCRQVTYLFSSKFNQSLLFDHPFVHKSWLTYESGNDSVVIDVHVEPPSQSTQVHSYNGTVDWAIEDFWLRLKAERKGFSSCQEGPYFYTGSRGYRMQVVLMFNGNEEHKGKGPCAKVYFLTGEFDEELPVCFRHRTTVTLVDSKENGNSITRSLEGDVKDKKYYELDLGNFEEVEKLIENDTLYCKVKVEAL